MIFFTTFFNFALGAHGLFGSLLESYSTPWLSINTAFNSLVGEFNYGEMYELAPVTSSLWFWTFMIAHVFILLNLLTAIILDHYLRSKDEVGETQGLYTQVSRFVGEINWQVDWLMQRHSYLKQGILNPKTNNLVKGVKTIEELYEEFAQEQGGTLVYGRQHMLDAKKEKRLTAREALEQPTEEELSPKQRRKKEGSSKGTDTTPTDAGGSPAKKGMMADLIGKTMHKAEAAVGSMASMASRRMSLHERAALADEVRDGFFQEQ